MNLTEFVTAFGIPRSDIHLSILLSQKAAQDEDEDCLNVNMKSGEIQVSGTPLSTDIGGKTMEKTRKSPW